MSDFFSDFRKIALRIGFEECGFAKIKNLDIPYKHYKNWLLNNHHANMAWMENNTAIRLNPTNLFPWAKSYAIVALNYHNNFWDTNNKLKVSQYALLNDYHYVIKKKLSSIMDELSFSYPNIQFDFFVDSKPLLEKAMAVETGLGWIGKNTCFIIPKKGSLFFLGGVVLNIDYDIENNKNSNYCGNCSACIDACPTKALTKSNLLDARKCISYLTIEHKDNIDLELQKKMENNIIGCDICQNVCPHNKKAIPVSNSELINENLLNFDQLQIQQLSSSEFKKIFKNTPFVRMGFKKLKRNISISQLFNHPQLP